MHLLLSKHANVNAEAKDGVTSLHIAIQYRCEQIAEHLIKSGANVNAVYNTSGREKGYTPLHFAARIGNKRIIKLLLSKGANVNAQTKAGTPPQLGIDEPLTTYSTNINAVPIIDTDKGYTPLHFAARHNHLHVVKLLLEYGAKVDSTIKHGAATLLILAVSWSGVKIVEPILKLGANVNSTDEYGETALHKACRSDSKEVVMALVEHGSDVTIMNKRNCTALDCAMSACKEHYEFSLHPNAYMIQDFDFPDDNDRDYVNVIKILKRHMVKIEAANLYAVNKDILFRKDIFIIPITAFDGYNDELSDFQNECEKEIASMKGEIINDKITFYDILARSVRQVAMYATNENIVEALKIR